MEGLVRCLRASVRPDETSAALVAVLDGPASRVGPEGVESFVSLVAAHGGRRRRAGRTRDARSSWRAPSSPRGTARSARTSSSWTFAPTRTGG